ncbi:MAG: VWA domain-containing protein, partial [Acidobacteria bacterium]|nr:VWA domain-containing protein [Acidobacteriota bacterium]
MKTFAVLLLLLLQAQQPVFRANVNFVELDVSVLDKNRRPALDLTAADFTVLEDGVPQKVESFERVVLPDPEPAPTAWWTSVAADVERNTDTGAGNLYIIVIRVSDASLRYRVKEIARRLVDRMGPGDRMAVVHTSFSGNSQEFTSDKALLTAAIERYTGIDPDPLLNQPGSSVGARSAPDRCASLSFLEMVRDLARLTSSQTGRRKAAFVISDVWPPFFPAHPCFNPYLELFAEAQRAHLNLYPVNPRGLTGFGDVTVESADAMDGSIAALRAQVALERTVAENTGGIAITQTNLFDENIERAFVENRGYYILGYHSTNTSTDRKLRKLSVTVARPDVTVRSRSGYSVRRPAERTVAALPPIVANLDEATRAAVPATALQLDATAVPFRGPKGPMLAVVAAARPTIEAGGSAVQEAVQARATLIDRFGEIKETAERRIGSAVGEADGRQAELRIPILLPAKPGRYQVRVAANSAASGKTGSVFVYVDVPNFSRERLSLSGVAVRVHPDSPTLALPALESIFPFVPSTRRTFRSTDDVEAAVRVYANRPEGQASLTCRIRNAAEAEVSVLERVAPQGETSNPAGALVRCPVPVAALAAGHYLLEIDARAGSRSATR